MKDTENTEKSQNFTFVLRISIIFSLIALYIVGMILILAIFIIFNDYKISEPVKIIFMVLIIVIVSLVCYWSTVPSIKYLRNLKSR